MFNVDSLKAGIEASKKNIWVFEKAIEKERDTIQEYYEMIDSVQQKEREAKIREDIEKNIQVEVEKDGDNG